jgi:uncharacterized membrane protein
MGTSIWNSFKLGLGLSAGFQVTSMIFMFVGFIFFFPGYIMFKNEKAAGRKGSAAEIGGIILMGLGVIVMGGFGFSMLLGAVNDS